MTAARTIVDPQGRPLLNLDGLQNVLTGLGGQYDHRPFTTIVQSPRLTQPTIDSLYETSALAARIVDKPAADATRRWVEIKGDHPGQDADWTKRTIDALESLRAPTAFRDWLAKNRKDGGALLLPVLDGGGTDLSQPLDMKSLVAVRGLEVLERWSVQIELDPVRESRTYGKPIAYSCFSRVGRTTRIHASRVLALHGIRVSEQRDSQDGGWGSSVFQRSYEPITDYDEVWAHVQTTIKHFSHRILKMADLGKMLEAGQERLVQQRLAILGQYLSTIGVVPIDGADELVEGTVTFSGVAEVLRQAQDKVASATGMPITMLFGHAPSGLSTDDESGRTNWYDYVSDIQTGEMVPGLNRLLDMMFAARTGPTQGVPPRTYQITPRPLQAPDEDKVSERRYRDAQTDAIYIQSEAVTPEQVQARLRADPANPYPFETAEPADDLLPIPELDPLAPPTDAPDPSAAPGAGAPPAAGAAAPVGLATQLPNGAQIQQATAILKDVAARAIPRESGVAMLVHFYGLTPTVAEAVIGEAGRTFFLAPDGSAAPAAAPETAAVDGEDEIAPPATPPPSYSKEELRSLMTLAEVRKILGLGKVGIQRLVTDGTLRAIRLNNRWRFDPKDVHALVGAEPSTP